MTQAAIAICSQSTPPECPCSRTPSGRNISTSRVRLRAITGGGDQRSAVAVDHAQADDALAGRRAAPGQLEIDEIEIADEKADEQRDRHGDQRAAGPADQRENGDIDGKRQQEPDGQIDDEGGEALAVIGDLDRHRHPFGRDDLASLAGAFEKSRGALVRQDRRVGVLCGAHGRVLLPHSE